MQVREFCPLCTRFAVSYFGAPNFHFTIVLAFQSLTVNIKMKLPHPTYNRFVSLLVNLNLQSRVLEHEPPERFRKDIVVLRVLWLYRQGHHRVRNMDRGHREVDRRIAESGPRGTLHTKHRHDLAASYRINVFHFIRVHPHDPGDFHRLPLPPHFYHLALLQAPLINSEVRELTVPPLFELESEPNELFLALAFQYGRLLVFALVEGYVLHLGWIWEIIHDCIQNLLDAFILECRAHEYRHELPRNDRAPDGCFQDFLGQSFVALFQV
mmetsp:Transcript_22406/g.54738  ORF Transcript_22406/g.54738 Transcript_22406/m.54738 type:complete len:268 (-) Transcript_22406:753-1556(-)